MQLLERKIDAYLALSTRYAVDFLGIWERINNPDLNVTEFSNIRMEAGTNGFVLTSKQWIERTKV